MADVDFIVSWLKAKGLSTPAIAAILGNMQIESGFDTGRENTREGAIGLIQWEGSRRAQLQQYAAAHGTTEVDVKAQLGYMWQELTGSYHNVLTQLQNATDAGQAAAIFDQQYEVSSGAARNQRIAAAQTFAANGLKGGSSTPSAGNAISLNDPALGGGSKPQTAAGLASGAGPGPYLQLFNTVPELKQLMATAIGSGLSAEDFADQVHKTKWWATHSDNARQLAALQVADPATYKQKVGTVVGHINQIIRELGVPVTSQRTMAIANQALVGGLDTDEKWLTREVARSANYAHATSTAGVHGLMAQSVQKLQTMAAAYGQKWTPVQFLVRAQQMLMGDQTEESYKQTLINQAKSMFPGFSAQLDAGSTVEDLASPYKQAMGRLLEIDPQAVSLYDPTLRTALQGSATTGRQPLAVWQFEDGLRKDPRWDKTDNAKQSYAQAVAKIGADWGYSA